ncbi:ODF2L protein, partial [Smithornis capensis]|nr:ODF2L protein [Smithornis capensis]
VQNLQIAIEELKSRYETVLNENKKITENKHLEVDKVRDKTEAKLKELEHVCDFLTAAEEKQQKLMFWKRICAQKCKALGELQVQVIRTCMSFMGNLSLEEENCTIQKKYEDLKRQLGKMEFQNEELACQLRKEDEKLQCSKLKLEEKIAEYKALTRQLESALEEGRKMVLVIQYNEKHYEIHLKELENSLQKSENKNQSIQNYVQFLKAAYVTMFG